MAVFALALLALGFAGLPGCAARPGGSERVIKIAVHAPATGPRAELGHAVRAGVEMAVEDRRELFRRLGYSVEILTFDEADPRQGVANAHLIAADPAVVGVVGHLSSDVAIPASERYSQDGLALITVAATAPEFTDRDLENVFRLIPRDDAQGAAAARFASRMLKSRNVFVLHDRTVYGQGLADAFKAQAERLGVKVAGYRGVRGGGDPALLRSVFLAEPDLVFFGGDEVAAATTVRGLRRIGFQAPFLGGDSLDTPAFAQAAGESAAGVYYTALGGLPGSTPRGLTWVGRYRLRSGAEPHPLAALGYDGALILLDACARVAAERPAFPLDRVSVARNLRAASQYDGVAGPIRFDDRGDNTAAGADSVRFMRLEGPFYPGQAVPPDESFPSPR